MTGSATHRTGAAFVAAAGLACLALSTAAPAHAGDGSVMPNYTFPDGSKGFMLEAINGQVHPCILVGFDPKSGAPKLPITTLDLTTPSDPVFSNPFTGGTFTLEWDVMDFGDGSVAPPPAPNADGVTSFRQVLGDHTFETTLGFGPGPVNPASWVGFNPQPDPPGKVFGVGFQFGGAADPFMHFQMREDGELLNWRVEGVPEPASWSLLITGFGLAGAGLRRRGRAATAPARL